MFGALKRLIANKTASVTDRAGLIQFMDRQTAFVSQKASTEYCRSKAGVNWDKLMLEKAFLDAVEVSRWQAYLYILADVATLVASRMAEKGLAGDEQDRHDLAAALVGAARACLAHYTVPTDVLDDRERTFEFLKGRLENTLAGASDSPQEIAKVGGQKVFDSLPITGGLKSHDKQLVINSVRFLMLGVDNALKDEVDLAAVAADLEAAVHSA